jgi:hypothetical protein
MPVAVVATLFGERKAQTARRWATRRRPESRVPLRPVAARQKPQATAGRRRELKIEAARQIPLYLDLPTVVVDPGLPRLPRENARPAREVGDPAWDRSWPGLLAEADDALMWSSTGPVLCRSRMEPGAAAALLEDVTDRALRSEFKPDDGAGAGVVAEAVGDQSAQRPVITGSGDAMKVTMHFHN